LTTRFRQPSPAW